MKYSSIPAVSKYVLNFEAQFWNSEPPGAKVVVPPGPVHRHVQLIWYLKCILLFPDTFIVEKAGMASSIRLEKLFHNRPCFDFFKFQASA